MTLRLLVAASLVPLIATGIVVSAAVAGDGPRSEMARLRGVNFVSSCTFSHGAADDPIVAFGRPGASHHHSFVGNTATNASSTLESLLASGTTCHRPGDTAAYWMPTLLVDGRAVAPNHAQIYYRRKTTRHVEAFPPGFRMIAGDAKATSAQPLRVTFWNCGVGGGVAPTSAVPTCPDARRNALRLHVTFPSCWDGRNLDSATHQSHVAYPVRAAAPPGSGTRFHRSRSSTATRSPGRASSRSRPWVSSRGMPTSSTRGGRATCRLSSTDASTRCVTASAACDARPRVGRGGRPHPPCRRSRQDRRPQPFRIPGEEGNPEMGTSCCAGSDARASRCTARGAASRAPSEARPAARAGRACRPVRGEPDARALRAPRSSR